MKEVKAIIQPFMVSKVIEGLKAVPGLPGVTVSEVKGFGKSHASNVEDPIVEDSIGYSKKVKLEIVVQDDLMEEVVEVIQTQARTGRLGDGKIFVTTIDDVVKIRTGERGTVAI